MLPFSTTVRDAPPTRCGVGGTAALLDSHPGQIHLLINTLSYVGTGYYSIISATETFMSRHLLPVQ